MGAPYAVRASNRLLSQCLAFLFDERQTRGAAVGCPLSAQPPTVSAGLNSSNFLLIFSPITTKVYQLSLQ